VQSRLLRVAMAIAAVWLVAACTASPPAPAEQNAAASEAALQKPESPKQAPVAKHEARQIVVRAGQSVSRIAAENGISQHVLVIANNLMPPFKIKIGQRLLVPAAGGLPVASAVAEAPASPAGPADLPAVAKSAAPSATATIAGRAPPLAPPSKAVKVDEPLGSNSTTPLQAPVASAPMTDHKLIASSGSAVAPAPVTTATPSSPVTIPSAPPPGVVCPAGTTGMWSTHDVTKIPVYICHRAQSQN
jgi:LysM repeat protein